MDRRTIIAGVILTPLKKIPGSAGSVYHGIKKGEATFFGFGEAYFSTVNYKAIKGWKKHTQMISNIIVPIGAVKFVLYDDRSNSTTSGVVMEINLSIDNYYRLTIPQNIWMAFQGLSKESNILLNLASIPHDPDESITAPIDTRDIPFDAW